MLKYKYEVQNRCTKCDYAGYDFKLYEEVTVSDDFGTINIEYEVAECPKCGFEEKL